MNDELQQLAMLQALQGLGQEQSPQVSQPPAQPVNEPPPIPNLQEWIRNRLKRPVTPRVTDESAVGGVRG